MAELPSMNWWADAYWADTRHLTLEEHGAYRTLIDIAWRLGGQPIQDDDKRIAQMLGITRARWLKIKPVVMAFWERENDGWVQKRIKKEWKNAQDRREKAQQKANARWNANQLKNNDDGDAVADAAADAAGDAGPMLPLTTDHSTEETSSSVVVPLPRRKAKRTLPPDWEPEPFSKDSKCGQIILGWQRITTDDKWGRELEAFKAHHGSRANVMADWQQAWATWVLNSVKFERSEKNGHADHDRTLAAAEGAFGPADQWTDDHPF